ncbi:MAG: hypothetical protein HYT62_04645, partial [Candidatus Yanofskybacteria bacterium]|nr:hypothetical protein [Candidatus Yanofskybacteria bacterium]
TDEQIAAMVASGVSAEVTTDTVVAERSGSDDKVAAVVAEGAGPRVATYTPEGRAWMEADTFGLKTEGIYGKKGQTALQPVDLQRHAQVVGSLDPAKLETIHGRDETAPDSVICPICTKAVTSFVRTALIDRTTGDLVRDNGVVRYRGQFVAVGPDPMNLPVIGFHPGECLFRGRLKRDRSGNVIYKTITLQNGRTREIPDLLPCHNFAQANERSAAVRIGLQAKRDERVAEEGRMRQALGFKVGDTARTSGGNRTDDGINRGSYAPKTPRGQHRGQRRWVDNEDAS